MSLPKEWRPKRITIWETRDLNTLFIDDLIGSLIFYEEDLAIEKGDENQKKSIALKASRLESDKETYFQDDDFAMIAIKLRRFFKKQVSEESLEISRIKNIRRQSFTLNGRSLDT